MAQGALAYHQQPSACVSPGPPGARGDCLAGLLQSLPASLRPRRASRRPPAGPPGPRIAASSGLRNSSRRVCGRARGALHLGTRIPRGPASRGRSRRRGGGLAASLPLPSPPPDTGIRMDRRGEDGMVTTWRYSFFGFCWRIGVYIFPSRLHSPLLCWAVRLSLRGLPGAGADCVGTAVWRYLLRSSCPLVMMMRAARGHCCRAPARAWPVARLPCCGRGLGLRRRRGQSLGQSFGRCGRRLQGLSRGRGRGRSLCLPQGRAYPRFPVPCRGGGRAYAPLLLRGRMREALDGGRPSLPRPPPSLPRSRGPWRRLLWLSPPTLVPGVLCLRRPRG